MECCGEERLTPFCPQCGEPLNPLLALLAHVEKTAAATGKWFSNLADVPDDAVHPKTLKRRQNARKWRSWADALRELLQSDRRADAGTRADSNKHNAAFPPP